MRLMLAAVTGLGLGAGGAYAVHLAQTAPGIERVDWREDAARAPQRLVIGLDISKSNPLVEDSAFAAKVAQRIGRMVARLGFRSEVHVRTLGNYDAASNGFYFDAVISTRNRPARVAADVQRLIAGTPMLVRTGKWQAQNTTNILAFLDNVSHSIGCSGMKTTIILASDGIEDSEYAHLNHRDAHLPAPSGRPFAGCAALQILGLGQGTGSPVETVRLRHDWARWSKAAGFKQFQGLNDW